MAESTKPIGLASIGTSLNMDGTEIKGLLKTPGMGGTPEKIEVTDLSDAVKRYVNGVKDNGELEFECNYDNSTATSNFRVLMAAEKDKKVHEFTLKLPDGTSFKFSGLPTVNLAGIEVNNSIKFTLQIALTSDITTTDPSGI